ncbi:MAG: malonyl-ACP O-methyltransferase BioC [Candidatus Omnitrophica bacterium]|nr:malonyl-ACP O-methyltransferase BioC [Candidatus Omnitrophota bacterium]
MVNKSVINNNFSKSAFSYDDHSHMQKRCAGKLIDMLGRKECSRILEIGCGTGVYTRLLNDRYPKAHITATDISELMVGVARKRFHDKRVKFLTADGDLMVPVAGHDLITSNASFQWFDDLRGAFERYAAAMASEGVFCFSMYGPGTFKELKEIVRLCFGPESTLSSDRFIDLEDLRDMLGGVFRAFDLKEEFFTVEFPSLMDLLVDIKHSGARGEGIGKDHFLGKNMIRDMERTYLRKYGKITATHHVYFCKAVIG